MGAGKQMSFTLSRCAVDKKCALSFTLRCSLAKTDLPEAAASQSEGEPEQLDGFGGSFGELFDDLDARGLCLDGVPAAVVALCEHLRAHPDKLSQQGVFRLSSDASELAAVVDLINQTEELAALDLSPFGAFAIAAALKKFFRAMPEPLFPESLYPELVSHARRREWAILESLPSRLRWTHAATLDYLLEFLVHVASVRANLMPIANLAAVVGPNLIRSPPTPEGMSDVVHLNALLHELLRREADKPVRDFVPRLRPAGSMPEGLALALARSREAAGGRGLGGGLSLSLSLSVSASLPEAPAPGPLAQSRRRVWQRRGRWSDLELESAPGSEPDEPEPSQRPRTQHEGPDEPSQLGPPQPPDAATPSGPPSPAPESSRTSTAAAAAHTDRLSPKPLNLEVPLSPGGIDSPNQRCVMVVVVVVVVVMVMMMMINDDR